jgi:hypothetical protein
MTHISRSFRHLACAGALLALSCGGGSGGGPSAAKNQFCDKVVAGLSKCPGAINKAGCLGKLMPFSDSDVREAGDCLRETTCTGMIQCLEEAFPGTGTPGTSTPGTGGTTGTPGTGGTIGTPGTGGVGGPAAMCAGQTAKNGCDQCVYSSCCNQFLSCAGDPGCSGFISCAAACKVNMVCQMNCVAQTPPASLQLFEKFDTCFNGTCGIPCQ